MQKTLIIDGIKFNLWIPSDEEKEFQPIVKEHSKDVFGKDSVYLDVPLRLKSETGLGSQPDGFVIDPVKNELYLVEVELSRHDVYKHINDQLTRFINGLDSATTRSNIVEAIFDEINENKSLHTFFEEIVPENLHRWLSKLLNKPLTIVVIIEEKTQKVLEACRILMKSWDTKILEFQTFKREDAPTVHAHLFESLNDQIIRSTLVELPNKPLIPEKVEISSTKPKAGDYVEMELRSHSERKFALFNLNETTRRFFPPYKIDFLLETDLGDIKSRVTSAPGTTQVGDALAGSRIQGGLVPWFKKHTEVNVGTKVRFECIEPLKKYKLTIV
jgi:hypothetical protein